MRGGLPRRPLQQASIVGEFQLTVSLSGIRASSNQIYAGLRPGFGNQKGMQGALHTRPGIFAFSDYSRGSHPFFHLLLRKTCLLRYSRLRRFLRHDDPIQGDIHS
jgi:hypothetical protein